MQRGLMLITLVLLVTGCSMIPVYKPDTEQGNIVTPDMVAQLKPGMSRKQVQYVMGTPVLEETFDPNRWDYVYTFQPGKTKGKRREKRLSLYFENNTLARIINSPDLTATNGKLPRPI